MDGSAATRTPWLLALAVFLAAAGIYALYGDQGELYHDHGIVLYAGQQFADGVPPYLGIFDHKGPGGAVAAGCGVWLGGLLGSGDVAGARLLFLLLSAATVSVVFLLTCEAFRDRWAGLLAAASFLTYWGFGQVAFSGPEPKTPMVLFQALALWLTARRRWFGAGLAGGLAFLVWQPMAVLVVATAYLGWRLDRGRGAGAALAGGALPVLVTLVYYAAHGALYELADGMALFNLTGMENERTLVDNVKLLVATAAYAFKSAGVTIPLGAAGVVLLIARCLRRHGRDWARDPAAVVLLTFPAPVLWSVLDFQGFPDFFCFLPYTALGFGWLLAEGLERIEAGPPGRALVALVIAGSAAVGYRLFAPDRLGDQRAATEALVREHGEEARFLAVGAPHAMVLLERRNPTPYLYMMRGIQNHVDAHVEGGFAGWLDELEAFDADVVLTTDYARREMGPHGDAFGAWLEAGYVRGERYWGNCILYVKR